MGRQSRRSKKPERKFVCAFDGEDLILCSDGDTLLCPECGQDYSLRESRKERKEHLEKHLKEGCVGEI